MKYLKTFEGLFDGLFKKQELPAKKIYQDIINDTGKITDVIKEEKPVTTGELNIVKFKYDNTDYSISRISVFNDTKYVLKMGNMVFDCSQSIAKSIYNTLWYRN